MEKYNKGNMILQSFPSKSNDPKFLTSLSLTYDSRQLNESKIKLILIHFIEPDTVSISA